MIPENHNIPAWVRRERQGDLSWIAQNLDVFSGIVSLAFEDEGRGAIVVDTTIQPMPGAGNPFGYFTQEQIEGQGDEDISRMVAEYDPTQEFVVVLLKREDRTSTYRVGVVPPGRRGAVASENTLGHTDEQAAAPELRPPDVETLIAWEAQGGCEAACPHRCWVEADGTCPHGNPSWLLKMGLI